MENNFLTKFNDGIPIYSPITIYLSDLINLSIMKDELKRKIETEYDHFLRFLNHYSNGNSIKLFMTLCIMSNNDTLERELHFSPKGYINSLLYNLNYNNVCNKSDYRNISFKDIEGEDGKLLDERVEKLRNIGLDYLTKQKELLSNKSSILKKISDLEKSENKTVKKNHKIGELIAQVKKIDRRINKLDIMKENEMLEEFPFLKESFELFKKDWNYIREQKAKIDSEENERKKRILRNNLASILKRSGYTEDLDTILEKCEKSNIYLFTKTYADTFENLINNTPEIVDYLLNNKIEIDDFGISEEELELYIAHQAMESCEYGTFEDRQNFIYYATNYFKNKELRTNDSLSINVEIDNDGSLMKITPSGLFERYEQFLLANPDIRPLDLAAMDFSNMRLDEIQDFISAYLEDLKANWEIIPKELFENEIKDVIKNNNNEEKTDKDRLQRNLLNQFIAKTEFYSSLDPFHIIMGKNTFEGYRGFVFTNGIVFLEKFYDDVEKRKLTYGAIYAMNINDFHELSKKKKIELMTNKKVKRIVHDEGWQNDVLDLIGDNNNKVNPAGEVKRLIMTGEIKKQQ